MPYLRSDSAKDNMEIAEGIKTYFEDLIKPLVTNNDLKEVFKKYNDEMTSRFEAILKAQQEKIEILESKVETQGVVISHLETKCDDLQQYSRRSSLRIHGIRDNIDEDQKSLMNVIESCYGEVNVPFVKSEIDRAHRIGKSYTNRASGEKVRSIIIKYKSWESRE